MEARQALKHILKEQNLSVTELSRRMGKNRVSVSSVFNRQGYGINMEIFVEHANALGYEVLVQPRDGRERQPGQIVIDPREKK